MLRKYAVISNVLVDSVVELDYETDTGRELFNSLIRGNILIDIHDMVPQPTVGWKLEGNKLTSNGMPTDMRITKLAMRNRFTLPELMGIYTAAQSNVAFKILLDNLSVATFIDLSRPDTIGGIQMLVQAGILTQERATAVLTTLPTALEIYREGL